MRRFLLVSLLVGAPAVAQDTPEIDAETGRPIVYSHDEIKFDEIDVNATIVKPSVIRAAERMRASFTPLIELRKEFDREMQASVDDIK